MLASVGCISCANGEKEKAEVPEEVVEVENAVITKKQPVDLNVSAISMIKEGEQFDIYIPEEDRSLTLRIRKILKPITGITTLSAFIEDMNTGQANLVLSNGRVSGRLQLYQESKEYTVGYDTTSASHYIQEVTPEMKDRLEGSAPLIPGQKN